MQLKIKIAIAAEEKLQQPAPFDKGKIARFSVACVVLIVITILLILNISKADGDKREDSPLEPKVMQQNESVKVLPEEKSILTPPIVPALESSSIKSTLEKREVAKPNDAHKQTVSIKNQLASEVPPELQVHKQPKEIKQQSIVVTSNGSEDLSNPQQEHQVRSELVKRAVFTSEVLAREPVDDLGNEVSLSHHEKVYFYTQLIDLNGQKVEHRWYLEQELKAIIRLKVSSDNWRTYSSKTLNASMQGNWRVEVVIAPNTVLEVHNLDVSH